MTLEEQKAALDQLGDKINNKLNEATEKIAKGEKATSAVKDELNKLIEDHKTQTDAVIAKHEEAAGRIDSLETKLQRLSKAEQEAETFGSKMEKAMTETLSEKGHVSGIFTFEGMDTKAIMLQTTALTGDVIQPDRVRGIVSPMERERHIRPYMASGRTGSNTVDYVEETAYTDGMAGVAEGRCTCTV
jgi:HK97 family phage major capsid protein